MGNSFCFGCMHPKVNRPICEHCGHDERKANQLHQLPVGTVLNGQYVIGKVLGQGGFGITYLGYDRILNTKVAIKEYFPNTAVQRNVRHGLGVNFYSEQDMQLFQKHRDRFLQEAQMLAKLSGISEIVQVKNYFTANNTAYIVMEYVDGITLAQYVQSKGGKLSAEEMLRIMNPVFQVLQKVHDAKLIHRDISPDNIMCLPDGSIKLIDFGTVRQLQDGSRPISTEVVLKHGFAPMEQYNSHGNLGPWTDVYALCASCYYCLTGKCPQDAPSRVDQGETLTELYKNPSIGRELIQTLEQGMTIRIQDRIQSVAQLQKKLCQPPKRKRNKKWLTIAAAAVTAVSLMAGGVAAMGSRELAPVSDPVQNQPPQMQFTDAPDHPAATTAAVQTEPKQSVQSQRSVVAVAAGLDHTVVLLSDGTVQATGANQYGQCDVEDWQDIVQISVLKDHTVGLCADGTVVAVGDNGQGQCDVAHWDNIIAVAAGGHHTVGLRSDGTVVTAGEDWYGEGELYSWCDVTAIAAGYSNTYGLCKDGTVLVSGSYKKGKITGWNNITAIAASDSHVVGLCADGTAKGVGTNSENQCDLEHWNNMVSVSAGCGFSVGLRADGKVLVQGINDQNQHGAAQWTDVAFLSCGLEHVVAVRKDGLLVAVGANDEGQCAVSKWNSN